jgi:hypothetical protein
MAKAIGKCRENPINGQGEESSRIFKAAGGY